jgi:hypothetical protein
MIGYSSRSQLIILHGRPFSIVPSGLYSLPSGLQTGLLEMMGPTPPFSTVSRVSLSVGVSGTASIAHSATATVLRQALRSLSSDSSDHGNNALGSVVF